MMHTGREEEEIAASLVYPYWYGKPVRIRPWWFRSESKADEWKVNWAITSYMYSPVSKGVEPGRGWFTSSFPIFGPYYPMPSAKLSYNYLPEPYYSSFWWP